MVATHDGKLFALVLASIVHDIKNALGALIQRVEHIRRKPGLDQDPDLQRLELDAMRLNQRLIQLLVMYKIESRAFQLLIDEHAARDVIDEAVSQQYACPRDPVHITIACHDDLLCYCDFQNLGNVLATVIDNALRYSRHAIRVSAEEDEGYVVFVVEDDGPGYPESMLEANWAEVSHIADWMTGHTGLGLYFASVIAGLHKNAGRRGSVKLDNHSRLGGARFRLFLP